MKVEWCTPAQVAAATGIPVSTIRYHLRHGLLRGEEIAGRWRVASDEAVRWAETYVPYWTRAREGKRRR